MYTFRDVAARNFLVFPDNVVKIGDYGISTQTYKEDYYFTEEGVAIPIRWSSPETLNVSESVIETKKVNIKQYIHLIYLICLHINILTIKYLK